MDTSIDPLSAPKRASIGARARTDGASNGTGRIRV
jgi:hypothetical protein